MSSMQFSKQAVGAPVYGRPFIGPADHTLPIMVNVANLTSREVDARGYLKPGVILTRNGTLVNITPGASSAAAAVAGSANVGNGTVGSLTADAGAPSETITLTLKTVQANAGVFSVVGSVSGALPDATVAVAYNGLNNVNFTIADGSTDFALGDTFTIVVTGGAQSAGFGVVPEAVQVAASNSAGDLTAAGIKKVIVAVIAVLNRDIIEDNLESPLTDDEVNGMPATLILSLPY